MSEVSTEDVKNLEKLKFPDADFISNYKIAYNIAEQACESHQNYWDLIRACQRHLSGEKPIPPDDLKKLGMGWAWNYNYGKGRAKIEKGVSESVSEISSALSLAYVTFRNYEKEDKKGILSFLNDFEKRGIVSSAIGYALSSTLSKETRLSGWLNEVEYPSYSFGYCALEFTKFDWMPTPTHPLKIAFKPETKPEDIKTWVIFRKMDASELYERWIKCKNQKYELEEEDSEKHKIVQSGWNLECLEAVLFKAFKGKIDDTLIPQSWQDVIPFYSKNPSYFIANTEQISIAKIFYKELNGTLSEVYIPYHNEWQEGKPTITQVEPAHENNIIFKKNHGKFCQGQFISVVRDSGFSSEDGFIQDLRGICKFSVEDSIRYNRNRNSLGNKLQFIGSPMFENNNSSSSEQFKVTVSQGFVLLPTTHSMVEKQHNFDVSSHIAVLRFEEQEYNRDTQQFDASIQGKLTSRPNKGEVQRVTQEVENTNSAKNVIKMKDYSSVFFNVLTRMPKVDCSISDAGYSGKKSFYDNIKKLLPWLVKTDADINEILEAIDSFVMEAINRDTEAIVYAMQMAETPFARNRLKRMLLVATKFPIEEVNIIAPLITDKFSNMGDMRVAAIENDMFFTTNEVVVSGTDDHVIHLESHLGKNQRVIKGVQEGAIKPVDAFKYLENNLVHSVNHNELFGQDPTYNSKSQEFGQIIQQQEKIKEQIKIAAQKSMEQEAQASEQIKINPETQAKIANQNAKYQADIQRKDWSTQQRNDQNRIKMQQDYELELEKLQLKYSIENK